MKSKNVTFCTSDHCDTQEDNKEKKMKNLSDEKVKSEKFKVEKQFLVSDKLCLNIDNSFPSPGPVPVNRTIILVRGSSYSLVDIPTFLPAHYTVSTRPTRYSCKSDPTGHYDEISLAEMLAEYKPRRYGWQSSKCFGSIGLAFSFGKQSVVF